MIDINFTYIVQIINFLILMGLMYKFLYNPMLNLLDSRSHQVKNSLDEAIKAKEEATTLYHRCVSEFEKVQAEALLMKEEAKEIGDKEKTRIIEEASKKAEDIMKQTKNEIDLEIKKAREDFKQQIGSLSIAVAEATLKKEIDDELKTKITKQYIEEIKQI